MRRRDRITVICVGLVTGRREQTGTRLRHGYKANLAERERGTFSYRS